MAVAKKKSKGVVIDKKTGRKRRVNSKLSRVDKAAAKKRKRKPMSAAHKLKIGKARRLACKRGHTKSGRKILKQGRPAGSGKKKKTATKRTVKSTTKKRTTRKTTKRRAK